MPLLDETVIHGMLGGGRPWGLSAHDSLVEWLSVYLQGNADPLSRCYTLWQRFARCRVIC